MRQPTKEQLKDQLVLAAKEIIRRGERLDRVPLFVEVGNPQGGGVGMTMAGVLCGVILGFGCALALLL